MALSSEAPVGVLLTSAARTADTRSDAQTNDGGYRGVLIIVECTVDPASASVEPKIEFQNPVAGEWEVYTTSGIALDTDEEEIKWILYPLYDIATALGLTKETAAPIPHVWRLFMDATDTDSLTYSAGYQYLN